MCCSQGQDLLCFSSDYLPADLSLGFASAVPEANTALSLWDIFSWSTKSTLKYEFSNCEGGRLFSHRTWGSAGEGVWFLVTLPTCDLWLCTQSIDWKTLLSSWLHSPAQDLQPDFSEWFKSAQTLACSLLCKWEGMATCIGSLTPYQNFLS